jgi:peptidoglycan/xylan/chitin deacetylase (PgdA/CDA1 family)
MQLAKRVSDALAWRFERLGERLERFRKALVVVNYHRLYDGALATDFDEAVYGDMSVEYFRCQLRWLRANAEVLSEDDLRGCLRRPRTFPRRGVLLTFDDGYRDNFTLAFPALKDEGLAALFFIPTQAMEDRSLGWWDTIAWLVGNTARPSLDLDGEHHSLAGKTERRRVIGLLQERFKVLPESATRDLLADLAVSLETPPPSAERQDAELMTVEQLREMAAAGMGVGTHTHTHRVLTTLTPKEQARELVGSKRLLEAWLGKPVHSLAYPVGRQDSFNEETKRLAREAGYEMAFSFYQGCNRPGRLDPFDLRRSSKRRPFEAFTASILYPRQFLPPQ